jgi:hypothetical protein
MVYIVTYRHLLGAKIVLLHPKRTIVNVLINMLWYMMFNLGNVIVLLVIIMIQMLTSAKNAELCAENVFLVNAKTA